MMNMKEKNKKAVLAIVLLCAVLFIAPRNSDVQVSKSTVQKNATSTQDHFSKIDLEAKSAVVLDVQTGKVLFARESESQVPLASLTKIMTAITAYDVLAPDTVISISDDDSKVESSNGLLVGEKWRFSDLARYTLFSSSNDGASAIARTAGDVNKNAFVNMMNEKARSLGLVNTYFLNETGLDVSGQIGGAYGSAMDVAKMLIYFATQAPEIAEVTTFDKMKFVALDKKSYRAVNTNLYVASMPNAIISKTGTTDLAGGNLAVIFDAGLGRPVAIVVLGSSPDGRFKDVEKLIDATLSYIDSGI
jgi:serine-type D-Ala-D-Ala carboxypeptidase (penicillin-binding protein 5/6)